MKKNNPADALKSQAEFNRQLQSGKFASLYLLEGAEVYLRDQALQRLIDKAVDASVRDFNVVTVSVLNGRLDDALAMARQYPMISAYRVVVVTDFENLNDERQLELLKDYLRDPAPTTALVFVTAGMDNRRNIATMLRKSCQIVSFELLDERDGAPKWLMDYVAQKGAFIEASVAAYLVGMVGTNLTRLASEADKLINYIGGKGRVDRDAIDALVRYTHEHSNFELIDAMLDGNRKRALELLDHIFESASENPQTLSLMMLGAIAANYRRMLMARELMNKNAAFSEVQKAVGGTDWAVKKLNERVRKVDSDTLRSAILRVAQTDLALKTSLATPRLQLELLVCELCQPRETANVRFR